MRKQSSYMAALLVFKGLKPNPFTKKYFGLKPLLIFTVIIPPAKAGGIEYISENK